MSVARGGVPGSKPPTALTTVMAQGDSGHASYTLAPHCFCYNAVEILCSAWKNDTSGKCMFRQAGCLLGVG